MDMLNHGKFVKNEVYRSKLENIAAIILREIYAAKEANSFNYLKLRTVLGNLGFYVPDDFVWETLWDEKYGCEGGLGHGDNIYSYYFENRKSIAHIPEWLRHRNDDETTRATSFLPTRNLAAEWFMSVVDYEDITDKLTNGLKTQNRTQDSTVVVESNGVGYTFDFSALKDETRLVRKISMSSIIMPKPITIEHDNDKTAEAEAAFLTGVLKGYFGYIAGVYK